MSKVRLASLTVFVRALRIEAEVGLYPHERGRPQPLLIDVELSLTPGPVRRLRDTVDYDRIVAAARAIAAEGHVELVETFAERLAHACLAEPGATRAVVTVEKPQAVEAASTAGVTVVCERTAEPHR